MNVNSRSRLLLIAPAPVIPTENGFVMDGKFLTGMALHQKFWNGEVDCLLREGAENIPFGAQEITTDPGFGLKVLKQDQAISAEHLDGYDVVLCSVDDAENLDIPNLEIQRPPKFFVTMEYTLKTRLQAAWLDPQHGLAKRLYTMLWLVRKEGLRKRFIRKAEGFQSNGYPAYQTYAHLNRDPLLYLDNRMTPSLFATEDELKARAERLNSGEPLRLIYSGRLEQMKGAHDLLPIASKLRGQGVRFHLDIFGEGGLKQQIAQGITSQGLENSVTLHAPVDFETELVPHIRKNSDIYLCCHRQSDPSCTYLENMGCGVAVVGYGNQMWAALNQASGAGWTVPMGDISGIVDVIAEIDKKRAEIGLRCDKALEFAKSHDFLIEFGKRMSHVDPDRS